MPEETKVTARAENPTSGTIERTYGIIAARRGSVPASGGSLTIPGKVRKFYIKNAHATLSFAFNFNSDAPTEYWTLNPGEVSPLLEISSATLIAAKGIGGTSTYEAIFMG